MATHIQIKCTDDAIAKGLRFAATACGMSLRQYTLYAAAKHTARLFADEPWGFDDPAAERALGNGRGAEQPASVDGLAELREENNALRDEITRLRGWMYNMRRAARRAEETVSDIVAVADEEC